MPRSQAVEDALSAVTTWAEAFAVCEGPIPLPAQVTAAVDTLLKRTFCTNASISPITVSIDDFSAVFTLPTRRLGNYVQGELMLVINRHHGAPVRHTYTVAVRRAGNMASLHAVHLSDVTAELIGRRRSELMRVLYGDDPAAVPVLMYLDTTQEQEDEMAEDDPSIPVPEDPGSILDRMEF
jgi:hypothetical protein